LDSLVYVAGKLWNIANYGAGWELIGTLESPFTGSFDGGGHTISNLFFNSITDSNIGLFGCTGETAKIRNLGLVDVNITGYSEIGGRRQRHQKVSGIERQWRKLDGCGVKYLLHLYRLDQRNDVYI
jgi:hypothetical protein